MSVIKCSETKFQEEVFYVLTSNKKPTLPKNTSPKFDLLEDILSLPNVKIPDFEVLKECQKHIFYFLDGAKANDFTILNNVQQRNSEEDLETQINSIPFPIEIKKNVDFEILNKERDLKGYENLQNEIMKIRTERDDLKIEINDLKAKNSQMQEEVEKLTFNYLELQKTLENGKLKNVAIKESHFNTKNKTTETTTVNAKKQKDKNAVLERKNFYTPRGNNTKKIVLPQIEDFNTEVKFKSSFGGKILKNDSNNINNNNTPHNCKKRNIAKNEDSTKEVKVRSTEKNDSKPQQPTENLVQALLKKKVISSDGEDYDGENRSSEGNEVKIQNSDEEESDEEILKEEDPRPFPGKFALKKFNSLMN